VAPLFVGVPRAIRSVADIVCFVDVISVIQFDPIETFLGKRSDYVRAERDYDCLE